MLAGVAAGRTERAARSSPELPEIARTGLMGVGDPAKAGMPIDVVVDDREPTALVEAVRTHDDVTGVEVRRLAADDLVMVASASSGRRSGTTQAHSSGEGPDLYDQIRRLSEAYTHSYVLLEDELPADGDEHVPAVAVRGSVASITARLGTPVISCADDERLVDLASDLGENTSSGPRRRPCPGVRSRHSTRRPRSGCTAASTESVRIPPTGSTRRSPPWRTSSPRHGRNLLDVEGVGVKRADAIYTAFRTTE